MLSVSVKLCAASVVVQVDEVLDRVRWFAEECDHLQGLQLITDATNVSQHTVSRTIALSTQIRSTSLTTCFSGALLLGMGGCCRCGSAGATE